MTRAQAIVGAVLAMGVLAAAAEEVPVGLDLTFENGRAEPLAPIAGRSYYIDSLAVMTEVHGDGPAVLHRLKTASIFSDLAWDGLGLERREWIAELDGTYQLQEYYRGAAWMGGVHRLSVTVLGGDDVLAGPFELVTTDAWPAPAVEPFATRRFAAVLFAHGAPAEGDTAGAAFSAQGWLQLRNGVPESGTFTIPAEATSLRVAWDGLAGRSFEVPLSPVPSSEFDYGLAVLVDPAPPIAGDRYAPGEEVAFRLTFVDGSGTRLHPPGSLPTYAEFMMGGVASGLQYYAFFPGIVYYRDKNREGVLLASLTGPQHRVRQTFEAVPTAEFLTQPVQVAATRQRDGFSSQWAIVPPAPTIFGGPGGWDAPVANHVTFRLPLDAEPGRYTFAIKARRVWRGEEALAATVVEIAVGTPDAPGGRVAKRTGNCERCHTGLFSLSRMLHHLGDVSTCTGCHLPLEFEKNNLLPYRIHRIHDLSDRYRENIRDCAVCHLEGDPEVVDNARWMVCTSCHAPAETHGGNTPFPELVSCADLACHHTTQPRIHILGRPGPSALGPGR